MAPSTCETWELSSRSPIPGTGWTPWEAQWTSIIPQRLHERIAALPEQTWENAWKGMPAKKRRLYFVLGCEGSRQKFGVDPNGDIFLRENFIRIVPGKDTPLLGWEGGELRFRSASHLSRTTAASSTTAFPILRTAWDREGLCIEQECYATWLQGVPDPNGAPERAGRTPPATTRSSAWRASG